ncbi:MAG TPA: ComEC/Rec2 family competence protein [Armatimonadota bacterium]|nr:ComEC/Rec2 family competence protein [Armatimonadota bacterium]
MRKILPIIVVALLPVCIAALVALGPEHRGSSPPDGRLEVHFLDVGQGDCILLQTPDGRNVLIDAGDRDSAEDVVRYLDRHGVDRIDLLVITHPHMDHIGGLPRVLERFGVSQVIDAGYPHGSQTYKEVLSSFQARRIDYRRGSAYQRPQVSKSVSLDIIWPADDYVPSGEAALNNGSVVVRATYGDVSLLLPGDIQSEAEDRILAARRELQSTILKVAHHGSQESTSNEFLQVVWPQYAVISVGAENQYGHPGRAVLRRLNACGAAVYRTDHNGNIVFTTDGRAVQVATER